MAKFWYKRILAGKATIEDVPGRWRESVQMLINETEKVSKDDGDKA